MKISFSKNRVIVFFSIVFLIVLWKILSVLINSENLLPSPENTFYSFIRIIKSEHFFLNIGSTLIRGLTGMFISLFLGLVIGIAAGTSKGFYSFITPVIVIIRSVPVVAFILLALIWIGSEFTPVFIGFLMMFPIITMNVVEGIRGVDKGLLKMAKIYQLSFIRMIKYIYIPSVHSHLLSGISNAMGFGWKAIIIGEVLSQPKYGIGTAMQESKIYLLVTELIAWTLIAVVISSVFELVIRIMERNTMKWKYPDIN